MSARGVTRAAKKEAMRTSGAAAVDGSDAAQPRQAQPGVGFWCCKKGLCTACKSPATVQPPAHAHNLKSRLRAQQRQRNRCAPPGLAGGLSASLVRTPGPRLTPPRRLCRRRLARRRRRPRAKSRLLLAGAGIEGAAGAPLAPRDAPLMIFFFARSQTVPRRALPLLTCPPSTDDQLDDQLCTASRGRRSGCHTLVARPAASCVCWRHPQQAKGAAGPQDGRAARAPARLCCCSRLL